MILQKQPILPKHSIVLKACKLVMKTVEPRVYLRLACASEVPHLHHRTVSRRRTKVHPPNAGCGGPGSPSLATRLAPVSESKVLGGALTYLD